MSSFDFENEVIKSSFSQAVVVEFQADWCESCKEVESLLIDHSKHKSFKLVKIDVDKNELLSIEEGVDTIPYTFLYKDGVKQKEVRGKNLESIRQLLD
jgi:thioredoxin-like negative regulator of GroEL